MKPTLNQEEETKLPTLSVGTASVKPTLKQEDETRLQTPPQQRYVTETDVKPDSVSRYHVTETDVKPGRRDQTADSVCRYHVTETDVKPGRRDQTADSSSTITADGCLCKVSLTLAASFATTAQVSRRLIT